MNKREFLARLRKGLYGLPQEDIEERLNFYGEMIDDRKEEGISEEEAVAAIGSVDEIAAQTIAETPLSKIAKERIKPKRRLNAGERVLLILGSPIWLSLGIALLSVIFSLYASLWAVIISLWSVFAALLVCFVGSIAACVILIANGNAPKGVAMFSVGIICAGLSIFAFFMCNAATKGIILFTRKTAICIKNCFIKKEEV